MKWIGLTGGLASGKSTVAKLLQARGYPVISADDLAREVVRPGSTGLHEVALAFGLAILQPDGTLNRAKLGQIVFADPSQRARLERILHPLIRNLATQARLDLAKQGHTLAFYDVPLLFEQKMAGQFDATVVVSCRPDLQIQRAMARDGLSQEAVELRIASQLPLTQKVQLADFVVENQGSLLDLTDRTDDLLNQLGKKE